jgi:hypothetical protein
MMKNKRISKVGARHQKLLADSKKQLEEIQERADKEIKKKLSRKTQGKIKDYVKPENDFDIGDIGVDIDEQYDCSDNNESEVKDYE